MFCSKCGRAVGNDEKFCKNCGMQVGVTAEPAQAVYNSYNGEADKPSTGLKVVCFLFPIIGLILWAANADTRPMSAKAYGKWALIGFIVWVVVAVIAFVAFSGLLLHLFNARYYYYY